MGPSHRGGAFGGRCHQPQRHHPDRQRGARRMSIKKRIKPGKIEPSADGCAIVVHFTTEITYFDEEGGVERVEKAPGETLQVPVGKALRGLRVEDIPAFAQEVVDQCRYIPASKTRQVEQALAKLHATAHTAPEIEESSPQRQRRKAVSPSPTDAPADRQRRGSTGHHRSSRTALSTLAAPDIEDSFPERQRRKPASPSPADPSSERQRHGAGGPRSNGVSIAGASRSGGSERWAPAASTNGSSAPSLRPADVLPPATPQNIEEYAEALYEDEMEAKALGAQKLLRLCTNVQWLEGISEHTTLLGVLSRELRENAKRSHELAVAITGMFVCLAHFSQFHPALTGNQCGEATMRIVEYESRRRSVLQKELKLSQGQIVARGSAASMQDRDKLEREEQRFHSIVEKQDRLLLLCLHMLRDLAEDPNVERKLVQHKICYFLLPLLSRDCEDLLLVTLGFLHKLSVFEQNKDQVVQSIDALGHLADLVGHANTDIALLALRVCYNLSFDARGRMVFTVQTRLLVKIFDAIQHVSTRKVALKVLYQISKDASLRGLVATKWPNCINLALHLAAKCKEPLVDADAASLCINFAADQACAAVLVEGDLFAKLVQRATQGADPLLLKVVRHVACHASVRPRLLSVMRACGGGHDAWLHELVHLATSYCAERPELMVEVMGTLAALDCTSEQVPWPDLCEAGLLELLTRLLMVGFSEDDALLECVILAGTLALDPESVPMLAASKVPRLLPELLVEKQEDGELIVQVLFAIRCLLLNDETCEVVLLQTDAVGNLLDIMRGGLAEAPEARAIAVQAAADEFLDLVTAVESNMDGNPTWTARIRAYRFEVHNKEWCHRCKTVPHRNASAAGGHGKVDVGYRTKHR